MAAQQPLAEVAVLAIEGHERRREVLAVAELTIARVHQGDELRRVLLDVAVAVDGDAGVGLGGKAGGCKPGEIFGAVGANLVVAQRVCPDNVQHGLNRWAAGTLAEE